MNQHSKWTMSIAVLTAVLALTVSSSAQENVPVDDDAGVADGVTVDNGILMNFRDVPLETVLDHLSEAAGFVIVKTVDVEGRITVISRQPLTSEEAVMVLNSVLHERGYTAIRSGRTLRIVDHAEAKRSNIPVRVGNRPEEIEETDEIITQVIPIRHADAGQLVNDLGPLISAEADVTANASSNALIMTDRSANIRRVVTIVSAIDTAISSVASVEVFPLQYANAADAARLINDIFSNDGQQGSDDPRAQFARMMRGRRGGGDDDDDSGSRVDAPVNAAADERTNTLVVTGSEDTLVIVADVLADLDANPAASQGVFVYQVRNGQADNLHAVLDTLFNAGNSSQDARDTRRPRGGETEPLSGRASSERREEREAERPAPQPRQQELEDPRQSFRERMMAQMAGEVDESATDLLGQVQIVSDMDTNSLLVMTSPANFEQVRKIIEQLDRPMPQVVIKALIAEVTHSDDLDLGAEFSILNIPEGSDLFTDFGLAAATGGMTYRLLETDIQATIRALQEVGKLEVLSRPYILASDNQEAIITVGSEVPFITSTSFTELGGSRSTVRYEDIGIILRVTPQINADGIVTMDVFPEISAISGESIEISPGVRAPVIAKRSAESRVAIEDGRTIVIGGLMEDQLSEIVRKVPFLGDIPLLGLAFQRRETEKSKTELLIFLTPHIVDDGEVLQELSDGERDRVQIVPEAVEPGEYQRHLEGLKRWNPDDVDQFEETPDDQP